jgi:lysophospholipase L1-like esterase
MSVKRPRSKRVLQNLAIFSATILVFLIGLEITLRLAGYGNVEVYDPDPVLYWKLRPNQDCLTKIGRHPVHINSRGTRGPEFQLPKPPGTFRILSLGDSKTFGWGVSEADTYSARLERLLQEHAGPGTEIEVINAGCNAWSYPQMRFYFRDIGLQYQPDLILIGDGNLWTQFSENNSPEFIESFMNRVRLKNFFRRFATFHYIVEDKFKGLYESQRAKFIPIDPASDALFKEQQQKDPDAFFRQHIDGLCTLALSNRVQPVLLFIPYIDQALAGETNRALKAKLQISRQWNVPLIDTTPVLTPHGRELYMEADTVHLTAEGNAVIARQIFESLTNLVKRSDNPLSPSLPLSPSTPPDKP